MNRLDRIAVPQRGQRILALDVLRGVAVALVLFRHAWPEVLPGAGLVGVVIFFALSGYLITGVLERDISKHGKVRYGRFYGHRAFRLLPALALFLAAYTAVELSTGILGDREAGTVWQTLIAALLYIKDFPLPFDVSAAIAPLWTLALEEQFYLLWPAALVWAISRKRIGRLIAWSSAGILLCMVVTVVAVSIKWPDKLNHVYSLPTTFGVALVAGGATYLYRERLTGLLAAPKVRKIVTSGAAVVLAMISIFAEVQWSPVFYLVGGPVVGAASCVLVLVAATHSRHVPAWTSPLRHLGTISYAAYLWNYMIVYWLEKLAVDTTVRPMLSIGLTVLAAVISWHTAERAGRAWRSKFDQRYSNRPAHAAQEPSSLPDWPARDEQVHRS